MKKHGGGGNGIEIGEEMFTFFFFTCQLKGVVAVFVYLYERSK